MSEACFSPCKPHPPALDGHTSCIRGFASRKRAPCCRLHRPAVTSSVEIRVACGHAHEHRLHSAWRTVFWRIRSSVELYDTDAVRLCGHPLRLRFQDLSLCKTLYFNWYLHTRHACEFWSVRAQTLRGAAAGEAGNRIPTSGPPNSRPRCKAITRKDSKPSTTQ